MKRTAILIDGEFFALALKKALQLASRPTPIQTHKNALGLAQPDEDVLRMYYYDSQPYSGRETHPVTGKTIDYSGTAPALARVRFLSELGQMNLIALRCGETRPRGWQLTDDYLAKVKAGTAQAPTATDYNLRFEQKGVDMRIGIDVATLALNQHVERIIVASNDTDLIPAFKVARRHGVQVIIAHIGSFHPHKQLIEDSDFRREYQPVA